jgi:hypothetical protein
MLADVIGPDLVILLVVYLAFIALFVVAWVQILSKAGHSGWWVLIGIVPLANIVMFLVFAFSKWPSLQRNVPMFAGGFPPTTPCEFVPPWTDSSLFKDPA